MPGWHGLSTRLCNDRDCIGAKSPSGPAVVAASRTTAAGVGTIGVALGLVVEAFGEVVSGVVAGGPVTVAGPARELAGGHGQRREGPLYRTQLKIFCLR